MLVSRDWVFICTKKINPRSMSFYGVRAFSFHLFQTKDYAAMSVKELVAEKEKLEDLIAEREISIKSAS